LLPEDEDMTNAGINYCSAVSQHKCR